MPTQLDPRERQRPLRILQVNKFHFLNGGAERYYLDLCELLRQHGHTVGHFSMKHPENLPSQQAEYFVEQVDYEDPRGLAYKLRAAWNTPYSREARDKIGRLLAAESYDLVHLHNFHHQITPSILPAIKKRGIPIVFTLHDFKVVCPNYKLLAHDGVCERCKGHRYYNCFVHRCNKGSLSKSLVSTVEMYLHRLMRYDALYDRFLTPSEFSAKKVVEFGLDKRKVMVAKNFLHVREYEPEYEPGEYLLYLGRLSSEKGLPTLVKAMQRFPQLELRIAGRGPYEDHIQRIIGAHEAANVRLLGHLDRSRLQPLVRGALAVILPSEWYETFGLCLAEACACGKPVIGARIGAIPELIVEGETGYLFESGNVDDLCRVLNRIQNNKSRLAEMGRNARRKAEAEWDAPAHYERIMDIYRGVLDENEA